MSTLPTLAEFLCSNELNQIPRQLADAIAPRALFPWQEALLRESVLLSGGDLLVVAPTGAGKSVVGDVALLRALAGGRAGVLLVGTRALARERFGALAGPLGALGYRVGISTRDDRDDDESIVAGRVDLVVTVYEKGQSLFLSGPFWRSRVGAVVADEVQILADEGRGLAARAQLAAWRGLESRPQFVGLTSAAGVAGALSADLGLVPWAVSERPVPLLVGRLDLEEGVASWRDEQGVEQREELRLRGATGEECAELLAERIEAAEKPVLVFLPTRREALQAACLLAARSATRLDVALEGDVAAGPLGPLLSRGVGLHTAELTRAERLAVEGLLREGRLGICCCTSTLAEGINVAARTVFYLPAPEEVPGRRGNCLGRAGRPGSGPGMAWVVGRDARPRMKERQTGRTDHGPRMAAAAFLLAAGWERSEVEREFLPDGLGALERGERLGLWDKLGYLTESGELVARGGLEPETVISWRTMLRRFPDGGSEAANLFLAIGGGGRACESLPLSPDERLGGRWLVELTELLEAEPDPLASYFLEFLREPESVPRRLHQAAKGVCLVMRSRRVHSLRDLELDCLVAAGLAEEFLETADFLLQQLTRLSRQCGGNLCQVVELPRRGPVTPRPATIIPVESAREEPAAPRLILRRGSTGEATFGGKPIQLTPLQFRLLELLARQAGEGVPYSRLESYVWAGGVVERQQISYHKSNIDRKLAEAAGTTGLRYLETVAGWGLRLNLGRHEVAITEAPSEEELLLRDVETDPNSIAWRVCL
jgi:DNA-binding winged helix-turn-helix (wHTH) protein